jgi:hypothetical protein
MNDYGIERRGGGWGPEGNDHITFLTREDGYEYWNSHQGAILVHRLAAVSKYGFDRIAGAVVHHHHRIPWANRPENLEVIESHRAHTKYHAELNRERRMSPDQAQLPSTEK